MRVLITGGAGFLGSHLANHLHKSDQYVRVLDDLSSGDPTHLQPGINFTRGDVRDVPKLWSLLHGIDVVYHLAARVSVPASILYPREYNDVNVGGTVALLEACRDVGTVQRVILAGSATVYGDQTNQPVKESMTPNPAVPYAVSKLAAEQYLFNIGRLSGFETVSLRIFNAYGPGQSLPPAHPPVIPQFMRQIAGKGSVVIFGDGSQTRDFVFVDDVIKALTTAAQAPGINGEIINIGSGVETSLTDLATLIGGVVKQKPNILSNPESSGGTQRLVADLTKARHLLHYRPGTSLQQGLQRLFTEDPLFSARQQAESAH
ncbi:MAG: NAD-dependent epimerase/dehydratase family protein [Caldilineaceae bacterium]|nr:NAD-dependent epimerase/dehydratase family protein [Caldilineaceae bacterium]